MKFLALVAFSATALAGPIYERDLTLVKEVMTGIGKDVVSLDNAFKAFNGDPSDLLKTSNTLIKDLKDGKAKVDPSPALNLFDALGLLGPVGDLKSKGDALVKDLGAAKTKIQQSGLCEITFSQASQINTLSNDLINSVVSKVPAFVQGIAKATTAGLVKDLKDAQDMFSPANCKNAGTPPPSSSAPAGTPTAPPVTTTKAGTTPPVTTPPVTTTAPATTSKAGPTDVCPGETVTVTVTDSSECTATKPPCPTVT
ncbi:hypothetical protein QQS21_006415 [Conoideocrella luteorostrata]|uniref:Cell wall protein n=1 Tax=Conoideocrella luteorostrata TaxID=1105319 RepID=A0AAJ0CMZ0_9HYPO|nr:hypothetical protein QQS21_006415 [Conoideocrella luteorostrata]